MPNDTIEIKWNDLIFSVLLLRFPWSEFLIYLIIKYCKRIHAMLLIENKINLLCNGIKYLSIKSLTLTTEVSIKIVTTKLTIKITKILLLYDPSYWISKAEYQC